MPRVQASEAVLDHIGRLLNRDLILVCGAPRTGTSWTAKALSRGPRVRYLREPLTQTLADGLRNSQSFRFLTAEDDDPEYAATWHSVLSPSTWLARRWTLNESIWLWRKLPPLPARLLIKEVNSPLALEWLAARCAMRVVITVRHPCGYVASGLRLEQVGHPVAALERLLEQPLLVAAYFADDAAWLARLADPVARMAAAFGMIYKVVGEQIRRHPEWVLVHHEALCADPEGQFRHLCRAVQIPYTPRIRAFLAATTAASDGQLYSLNRKSCDEPGKWKRELSAGQVATVAEVITRLRLPFEWDFDLGATQSGGCDLGAA